MRLDAHQHFWNYSENPDDFAWMSKEFSVLRNNFLPQDLEPHLRACGYHGTIAVQAREMEKETDFLLGLARDNALIKGVVGWVDLCASNVEQRLEQYSGETLLKGFRMLIHDRTDQNFANSPAHARGVGLLQHYNWTYDLLLRSEHLSSAIQLIDKCPNQKFVVDHIAKPAIDKTDWPVWLTGIRAIAERPNVYCKLSGLVTQSDWNIWTAKDFTPFLDAVLEAFGPERLMIGSDWPVCTCAAGYAETVSVVESWAAQFNKTECDNLFGNSCARFYDVA
jgi:L-fuconolactonase